MLDLVITGGQVVTPQGVVDMDVGVQGEKIAALGWPGTLAGGGRTIDARGKIVVPGGIEPHAHINIPVPEMWAGKPDVMTQPPEAATRAAAFGGVTTVIDFAGDLDLTPSPNAPRVPIAEHVERRRAVFRGHAYTDFAFHYILAGEVLPQTIGEIGEAIQSGVASFKIFTTFRPIRVPYGHLWSIFAEVAKHGGIMAVHAEEDDVVTYMTEKLKREGRAQGYNLHLVHNNISEDLAFRHIIRLAQHTGTAVYFVHTTAKEGVAAVAEARRLGQPVYAEALHNYLHFTCDDYRKPGGTAIHTYPAIKFADDRDALIAGLLDGRLATTATDEYTVHKAYKLAGSTIETVCGGHNGIETRMPVAFTKFVASEDVADAVRGHYLRQRCAHPGPLSAEGRNPAGQRRGPGADRSRCRKTIALADLHADADYSIWEGFACQGYPVMTILRGKVIVEHGKLVGSSSDGRWVERRVSGDVLGRPAV